MDNQYFHTIFIINNYMCRIIQKLLKTKYKISFNEYLILILVGICHKKDLGVLVDKTGLTPAAITILLKKMQQKGFIIIASEKEDARKKSVTITDFGHNFIHEIESEVTEKFSYICQKVGVKELGKSQEILNKLKNTLFDNL